MPIRSHLKPKNGVQRLFGSVHALIGFQSTYEKFDMKISQTIFIFYTVCAFLVATMPIYVKSAAYLAWSSGSSSTTLSPQQLAIYVAIQSSYILPT